MILGGTGSFGRAFVDHALRERADFSRITIFSRDEHKQAEMAHDLAAHCARLRYVLGDVRDAARLDESMRGVDVVINAAAMKHVPAAEANPSEAMRTNVEGAVNLARAAKHNDVKKVIALSSDKAVEPTTAYGASKFMMERVLLAADTDGATRFVTVRYANVFGSRGSVVPLFVRLRPSGLLPITDPNMTRFSITMREGIDLVLFALDEGRGGETITPVAPSYTVRDVATAIAPEAEHRIIGARQGEKMHEAMFSLVEAPYVARRGRMHVLTPRAGRWNLADYCTQTGAVPLERLQACESGHNDEWLSIDAIRKLVRTEVGT